MARRVLTSRGWRTSRLRQFDSLPRPRGIGERDAWAVDAASFAAFYPRRDAPRSQRKGDVVLLKVGSRAVR